MELRDEELSQFSERGLAVQVKESDVVLTEAIAIFNKEREKKNKDILEGIL